MISYVLACLPFQYHLLLCLFSYPVINHQDNLLINSGSPNFGSDDMSWNQNLFIWIDGSTSCRDAGSIFRKWVTWYYQGGCREGWAWWCIPVIYSRGRDRRTSSQHQPGLYCKTLSQNQNQNATMGCDCVTTNKAFGINSYPYIASARKV